MALSEMRVLLHGGLAATKSQRKASAPGGGNGTAGEVAEDDAAAVRARVPGRGDAVAAARLLVEEQRRDHQEAVEPAAGLVHGLGDEVRGECGGEFGDALVREAPLRERHRPRVEPA